ncbi:proline-rich protein 3-like [Aristolochia californica]|uniref:proline-rich protein 3-like n=1 Tax=Aristolochia californica TaxID=171875 RepID=UPI0035DA128C
MALKHFVLGCSLVFFLLLASALGGDSYNGDSPKPTSSTHQLPKADYKKPKVEQAKPVYDHPKPGFEKVKPDYEESEQPTPKPVYENPKVDYEKLKPGYQTAKRKVESEKPTPKPAYVKPEQKVDYEKPKQKVAYEKPDQKVEYEKSTSKPAYEKAKVDFEKIKPDYETPKPKSDIEKPTKKVDYEKPKLDYGELFDTIGVQGLVYCRRSAYDLKPLQGAVVRVTCLTKNEKGYESAPVSFLCNPTNEKGYFFITKKLSEFESAGRKVCECKASLHSSPSETCNVPSDAYYGITGAPLKAHRLLPYNKMQLYSVGPFFYGNKPEVTTPKGGGY